LSYEEASNLVMLYADVRSIYQAIEGYRTNKGLRLIVKTRLFLIKCVLALLCVMAVLPSKAFAYCTANGTYTVLMPTPALKDLNLGVPVGGVIWTGTVDVPQVRIVCTSGRQENALSGTSSIVSTNHYNSGIPGIVYTVETSNVNVCLAGLWPKTCSYTLELIPNNSFTATHTVTVALIKNGAIGTGTLQGMFGQWLLTETQTVPIRYQWSGSVVIQPSRPTCSTGDQTVDLGNVTVAQFSGVGSMTPPKAFDIKFNCSGGDAGQSSSIYLTLTDATVPSNRTSNLNLGPASTASGVAVRIQRDGGATDVLFGADSATIGNQNQWQAGTVATGTGTFSVPLQARMVQTGTVKPGGVSARATFTVAYN
jgi:type 1 fimbria pilin